MAEAYWELGQHAQYEAISKKTEDVLKAAGVTDRYVYAKCKTARSGKCAVYCISCLYAALHSLALCYHVRGNYAAAEIVSNTALSVFNRCVSEDHPAVGTGTVQLSLLYSSHSFLHLFSSVSLN